MEASYMTLDIVSLYTIHRQHSFEFITFYFINQTDIFSLPLHQKSLLTHLHEMEVRYLHLYTVC
jgi:hypothetical protein